MAADEAEQQPARVAGTDQAIQWALWMRSWILLERGDLYPALAAAEESVALAAQLDDSALVTIGNTVLGAVLVAHEEVDRGRELLALYDVEPGWICRWSPLLVEADLALGDLGSAEAHAARASALAAKIELAGPRAAAARAQSLVALARGNAPSAAELARSAVADAERVGASLDAARGRLLLARALAPTDREAAIRELTAAREQADVSAAQRVHDEAVRGLRRLGRRVGRGAPRAEGDRGVASLSTRERQIAGSRDRRTHQPRDRETALPQREDRRDTPLARLRQARRPLPDRGRSPDRRRRTLSTRDSAAALPSLAEPCSAVALLSLP